MELYVKKNEPVQAIQVKFPDKSKLSSFHLDSYVEAEIQDFLKSNGYYFEVQLRGAHQVIISCSKDSDLVGFIKDESFGFTLNHNDWIVIEETPQESVTGMSDEEFKEKHEPVEPYLDQVQQMVNEDRPYYGSNPPPTSKEEWILLKEVGAEIIHATQLTEDTYMIRITNLNPIFIEPKYITQNGKIPTK